MSGWNEKGRGGRGGVGRIIRVLINGSPFQEQ